MIQASQARRAYTPFLFKKENLNFKTHSFLHILGYFFTFSVLLKLENAAPNNGTFGVLNSVLKQPPEIPSTPTVQLPTCEHTQIVSCGECQHVLLQSMDALSQNKSPLKHLSVNECHFSCQQQVSVAIPERLQNKAELCVVNLCNSTLIYSKRMQRAYFVKGILSEHISVYFLYIFCQCQLVNLAGH